MGVYSRSNLSVISSKSTNGVSQISKENGMTTPFFWQKSAWYRKNTHTKGYLCCRTRSIMIACHTVLLCSLQPKLSCFCLSFQHCPPPPPITVLGVKNYDEKGYKMSLLLRKYTFILQGFHGILGRIILSPMTALPYTPQQVWKGGAKSYIVEKAMSQKVPGSPSVVL